MSVSGFSESDYSSQSVLWVAAVLRAFLGIASIAAELFSACPDSSSWVLFVPVADTLLVGFFGDGGSLVPFDVDWAKQALVLCPSLPHLWQWASFVLNSPAYSSGTSFIAALKDSHRISCTGNLSFLLGPVPPVVTAGPLSFSLAWAAFCSGFILGAASLSFSFWGWVICFFSDRA